MNYNAIDAGTQGAVKLEIPADWATTTEGHEPVHTALEGRQSVVNYVKNIQQPINAQRGNQLPVSTFVQDADGTVPQGTAAYEKRGIAVDVPQWIADNCIQCNYLFLRLSTLPLSVRLPSLKASWLRLRQAQPLRISSKFRA